MMGFIRADTDSVSKKCFSVLSGVCGGVHAVNQRLPVGSQVDDQARA
jgi:hypothetical protein